MSRTQRCSAVFCTSHVLFSRGTSSRVLNSDDPPNGEYWEARITANNSSHTQFGIVLTVLDTGEGDEEEQVANLKQLREWAVLDEDEDRAMFAQRPVDLHKAAAAKRAATNKKRGRTAPDIFASPVKGQRYCQPRQTHAI